ncbi:restriction endonuclease subunit S [Flavobacterium sp. I3-2]|uniref:restriction endonuclease subunit S n=1 Tax=Flavobacterium sp. I3-2 TaxID=2748319 RepID=UPI0015AEBEAD|nr:restriction endonuclease subunit S [Flavobacterium sp. I3-2]
MQKYEHYKDSGIDWIGPIPEHWEVKPGFTVLKERKEKNKGMISNNVLSLSYGKIIEKPVEKLTGLVPENFETYQLVYKGDIIFRPTDLQNDKVSLRTGLSKFNGIITSAYINLQPINTEPKFLHYYLHTTDTNKVIYGLGSGLRQNISFLDFKRFSFVVPPIHEQEAIAKFLDYKTAKIDALVHTKEQQIEKLKELRQAKIHQAVTKGLDANAPTKDSGVDWIGEIPAHWEVKRLKNLFQIVNGATPSSAILSYWGGDITWVTPKDVNNIKYISESERNISISGYKSCGTSLIPKGSIILTTRAPIGKVVIANKELCTNQGCKSLVKINNQNNEFIYSVLDISSKVLNSLGTGTTFMELSNVALKNFQLPIPPIQEQEQIVAYLDEVTGKIDQAIAQKQEQITKLKEYKQSLINDVVTGKVKVC